MTTTQSKDPNEQVNHPRWYNNHPSGIEAIDLIEHLPANLSHAFKYLWRCGLKTANDPLRELRSAAWYVRREIERRRKFSLHGVSSTHDAFSAYRTAVTDQHWRSLAEEITSNSNDLLADCLEDLVRNDLGKLAERIERAARGAW